MTSRAFSTPSSTKDTAPICRPIILLDDGCCASAPAANAPATVLCKNALLSITLCCPFRLLDWVQAKQPRRIALCHDVDFSIRDAGFLQPFKEKQQAVRMQWVGGQSHVARQ